MQNSSMKPEYQIGQLWIGDYLSWVEQLCLVSFRDAGHHVKLYTYNSVKNIPNGIEVADAKEILPDSEIIKFKAKKHPHYGSVALHSDKFRYHMLNQCERTIWADADVYCIKQFQPTNGYFFAWESSNIVANGGVLALPKSSQTLDSLLNLTLNDYEAPKWLSFRQKLAIKTLNLVSNKVRPAEVYWGTWGPIGLTHYLRESGEIRYAMPTETLYPVAPSEFDVLLKESNMHDYLTEHSLSIHFYGSQLRLYLAKMSGRGQKAEPKPTSMLGQLVKKHGIVPSDAPFIPSAPVEIRNCGH